MKLRNLVSMAVGGGGDVSQTYTQTYKVSSNSDMLRVGDLIAMYSEDTFGYIYNKRYSGDFLFFLFF